MTISIICPDWNIKPWVDALLEVDSSLDIQVWPDEEDKSRVEFALCWKYKHGLLNEYANLKCVSSMGAGIDHLLEDSLFPKHLPVVRIIDPMLTQVMYEYICSAAMYYFRKFDIYRSQQYQIKWQQRSLKRIGDVTIGIMGMGRMGEFAASKLSVMGFKVIGWSRSEKSIAGVTSYSGDAELEDFLSHTNILVCLLPLTSATKEILNYSLLAKLPRGAFLINVARGQHLVEEDLLTALSEGQIRGACLDVFQQEPLPKAHPFWTHERVTITPHCASVTNPGSVAPQIVKNYRLMQSGGVLINQVDMQREY